MRDIVGYEGLYGVTDVGDVWAFPKEWVSGNNRRCSHNGRWLNKRPDKDGYLKVMLCSNGKMKHIAVHRLVAQSFIPNPQNKPEVNHISGNKADNYVNNLEWCSAGENQRHAYITGLKIPLSGASHNMAKLTDEDVADIRLFANAGVSHSDIAKVYPVVRQTVSRVVSGKLWRKGRSYKPKAKGQLK